MLYFLHYIKAAPVKVISKPPVLVRAVTGFGKVSAGFMTTLVGGSLALPYFFVRQLYKEPEPDGKKALYMYKLSAKALLSGCKFVAMAWFATKFFAQATGGFVARVISGTLSVPLSTWRVGRGFTHRLTAQGNNKPGQFLCAQLGKGVGVPLVKVGQLIPKLLLGGLVVVGMPVVGCAAMLTRGAGAIGICDKSRGRQLFSLCSSFVKKSWRLASKPAKFVEDRIVEFERSDHFSGGQSAITEGVQPSKIARSHDIVLFSLKIA